MDGGLFERCHINENYENDTFVGIKKTDDLYEISFPLGFQLSKKEDEKEVRRDILLLISTLARYLEERKYEFYGGRKNVEYTDIPIQGYLYVIKDFFERGIYKESEIRYTTAKKGKIDWRRTIKFHEPVIQGNDILYLDYIVKKSIVNEDELITIIHQYCVYESFSKMGWLFTSYLPSKPVIKLTRRMMLEIVNNKIQGTFNDKNKQLFKNLLSILKYNDNETDGKFVFGTNDFQCVWEKMLDRVFGISSKKDYFPKTTWHLRDNEVHNNSELEPDTIMIHDDKIYVLDAKYYKYGNTKKAEHLPQSSSINKQITYGEYIAEAPKFMKGGKHPTVYNAFIMPFNALNNKFDIAEDMIAIGIAKSSWKSGMKAYENVVGVLVDIKQLMKKATGKDLIYINQMADLIERTIEDDGLRSRR